MAIPSSGTYTSTNIRDEWGYGFPFTSAQVASSAGLSPPWTSENLRGKSARSVSIITLSSSQPSAGQGKRYDRIMFGISVSDGATPNSYEWQGDAGYDTGSTITFYGPAYDPFGYTYQSSGSVDCNVVVAGVTYSPSAAFSYTAGDEI